MPHIAVGAEIGYIVSHLVLFYECVSIFLTAKALLGLPFAILSAVMEAFAGMLVFVRNFSVNHPEVFMLGATKNGCISKSNQKQFHFLAPSINK